MHQWKPGSYLTVNAEGGRYCSGLVYRGIGIEPVADDDSGAWYTDWDVTHLASGALIGSIVGLDEAEAFKLATMMADATDWAAIGDLDELALGTPKLTSKLLRLADLFGGSLAVREMAMTPPRAPAPHWAA
jgi:hypothetical protein